MNHEIIVEAALELKDVQEVNLFFTRTSRLMLAVVFFLMVIGIVLLVDENRTGMEFMIAFLLDVLLSVILWFVHGWSIRRKSVKAFFSDRLMRQRHAFAFSESGFRYASESESAKVRWSDIYEVRESRNLFLILLSTSRTFIVPKDGFATGQDRVQFRGIVESNVKTSRFHWRREATISKS